MQGIGGIHEGFSEKKRVETIIDFKALRRLISGEGFFMYYSSNLRIFGKTSVLNSKYAEKINPLVAFPEGLRFYQDKSDYPKKDKSLTSDKDIRK
jgi:hypothetical protein